MFAFIFLIFSLLPLSAARRATYDSSFAYLLVSNREDSRSGRFCVNYQQFRSKSIAASPDASEVLSLNWWNDPNKLRSPDNNNISFDIWCKDTEATSFVNAVVPFNYRPQICGRLWSNYSLGAIINFEIDELTSRMASAGLALVDKGRNYTGRWNDYLFSEFYDPDVRNNQTLNLFYIYHETFTDDVLTIGDPKHLELRFFRPPPFPVDPSMFIIWFMAMFCVLVGGISASKNYHKLRKSLAQHDFTEERTSTSASSVESSSTSPVNGQTRKAEIFGSDLCTNLFTVVSLMIIVVGILLLGFFFRFIMVTLFNVVLVIAGSFAVRCCVMGLLSFVFGFEDIEVGCAFNEVVKRVSGIESSLACLSKPPKLVSSIVLAFSFGICVFWFVIRTHPFAFVLLDLINVTVCIYVLKGMYFPNLKWLTVILAAMFAYDIFMVFGTPFMTSSGCSVMVEVASGNECSKSDKRGYPVAPVNMVIPEKMPVLFQVPRLHDPMISCVDLAVEVEYHPVMLGLGDVIVPGYLIGFCFTADLAFKSTLGYGIIASIGYGIGLVVTFISLLLTETAQPALIYLIPFSLFPVIVTALCRGELAVLWTGTHIKTLRGIVGVNNQSSEEEPPQE